MSPMEISDLARQHICDVNGALRATLSAEATIDLSQAACIASDDRFGIRGNNRLDFIIKHRAADVWHFDGEQAAESAALISACQFNLLNALYAFEERSGLFTQSQTTQTVTGVV